VWGCVQGDIDESCHTYLRRVGHRWGRVAYSFGVGSQAVLARSKGCKCVATRIRTCRGLGVAGVGCQGVFGCI